MDNTNIKSAGLNDTPAAETKPCLVQTAQGFTVSFKGKLLYSKYNPQKAIEQLIQNLTLQPQTIILCVSPVLPYGLKELAAKLPPNCIMLGCETNPELQEFIAKHILDYSDIKNFSFLAREELFNLGPMLTKRSVTLQSGFVLPQPGTFRRIIKIDFSAGAQFGGDIYDRVVENAASALMTFWANRVTLVKFGRKYCTNFFKNLTVYPQTVPVQKYFGSVEKPVIVFGAGESLSKGVEFINSQSGGAASFFILCADTALQPLVAQKIIPDGVFIEEAQNVISRCFIGMQNYHTHVFAGLSSNHSITRYFKPEQISFFTTEFIQAGFIDRFEAAGILPPKNEPFGSVGITTFYYANLFRKDSSIPVKAFGLDFAYSAGRTHTKGTMLDNARFMNSNRLKNDTNFAAAFCEPAFIDGGMYTTPILQKYRQMFIALRQAQGPQTNSQGPQRQGDALSLSGLTRQSILEKISGSSPKMTCDILEQERIALLELKALLTGEKTLPLEQQQQEITKLICEREYLYLHFPDGHKFVWSQSFLNRVRVEVEYFLKVLS